MEIRRATAEDTAVLARVHVDSWRAAYRGLVPDSHLRRFTCRWREECFRKSLATDAEETYLARVDEDVVGFVTLGTGRDADLDAGRTGEIWGIYIAPASWRQGIGTKVEREAEKILKLRGYEHATLWVLEDNQQARRFYETLGFRLDGADKTIDWGRTLKAVRYGKVLDPAEMNSR